MTLTPERRQEIEAMLNGDASGLRDGTVSGRGQFVYGVPITSSAMYDFENANAIIRELLAEIDRLTPLAMTEPVYGEPEYMEGYLGHRCCYCDEMTWEGRAAFQHAPTCPWLLAQPSEEPVRHPHE